MLFYGYFAVCITVAPKISLACMFFMLSEIALWMEFFNWLKTDQNAITYNQQNSQITIIGRHLALIPTVCPQNNMICSGKNQLGVANVAVYHPILLRSSQSLLCTQNSKNSRWSLLQYIIDLSLNLLVKTEMLLSNIAFTKANNESHV